MLCIEKQKKIYYFLAILPPDLPLTASKVFKRSMVIILRVSVSSNLPLTVDYSHPQVNL